MHSIRDLNKESDYEKRKEIISKYLKVTEYGNKKRLCYDDFYTEYNFSYRGYSKFTFSLFDYLNDDYNHICLCDTTHWVNRFPAIFLNSTDP